MSLIENGVNPEALAVSQKNLDGMNHGNGTRANDSWVPIEDSDSGIEKRRRAFPVARGCGVYI